MNKKTLKDRGILFEPNDDCTTCNGSSCHNRVIHKNGREYNVCISRSPTKDNKFTYTYTIDARLTSNTSDESDIYKPDLTEEQTVKILDENFDSFKCY